jgi:hypothetical protein
MYTAGQYLDRERIHQRDHVKSECRLLAVAERLIRQEPRRAVAVQENHGRRVVRAGRLSPGAQGPIQFRVLLDGEAPRASHGVDLDEEGNGVLRDGRLYQLLRQHDGVGERTLEITFLEPGAEAYSFTFG